MLPGTPRSPTSPERGLSTASPLRWAVVGLTAAALYVCWPLWPALLLAAWTAALARPLHVRFERWLGGRRRAAAALSLLLFIFLLIPLVLVTLGVIVGAQDLWRAISETSSAKGALATIAAGAGAPSAPGLPTSFPGVTELIERFGAQALDVLSKLAGAAARGLVGLFIYLGGAYVLLLDGPAAWSWIKRRSPLEPRHLVRFAAAFHETGRGLLVSVGLTTATQGVAATLIYLSLGVPRWWVLGAITGLASMVPLVGSALVWGPICAGLFITGHPIKGAILAGLGVVVISTVDNLLHPLFARLGALKLPTFVVLVALLGGVAVAGPWGALLGPLVVRLWLEAISLTSGGRAKEARHSESGPPRRRFGGGLRRGALPRQTRRWRG